MKLAGAALALVLLAAAYATFGITWASVIAAGLVGILLSQAMHATGGREAFTVAGSICLGAALLGALFLLLQLFMG